MKKNKKNKTGEPEVGRLRIVAEEHLQQAAHPAPPPPRTEAEVRRLVHELEIHQEELKLQNEELVQAKVETEAALEKYSELYDFSPAGYFTLSPEGIILLANLTGARLLGVDRGSLRTRRFRPFVAPAEQPVFDAFLKQVFLAEVRQECEVTLVVGDHLQRMVQLHATPSPGGRECLAVAVDITGRKRAESALRASEADYREIFNATSEAFFIMDGATGEVLEANHSAVVMYGYATREELLGHTFLDLHAEAPAAAAGAVAAHLNLAQAGAPQVFECLARRPQSGGGDLWVEASLHATAIGGAGGILAVVRDIALRKQAEADRLILGKLESLGILAGGIAHDFNNLLAGIMLEVHMASMAPGLSAEAAQHLDYVKQAVLQARSLTSQFITFAKGGAPQRKPASLAAIVQQSATLALSGSTVRCDFSPPAGLWPAEVDDGQMGQVFRNLILNAREAMPGGGIITITAENLVLAGNSAPALPPGEYVRITVADHGPGIPPEILPRIFDPYFSTKDRGAQKGMGLGLTICHAVVHKHGGAITVESAPGAGATFQICLPACPLPAAPTAAPAAAAPGPVRNKGRVLLLEDEDKLRASLGKALVFLGFEAELAAEGRAAIELFQAALAQGRPFAVVILDLTVRGGVGGLEAIRELRALDPGVKAVVVSGYHNDPVLRHPQQHGFQAGLAKPFDLDQFRDVLTSVTSGTACSRLDIWVDD